MCSAYNIAEVHKFPRNSVMEFQNICNEMVAPFLLRHPVDLYARLYAPLHKGVILQQTRIAGVCRVVVETYPADCQYWLPHTPTRSRCPFAVVFLIFFLKRPVIFQVVHCLVLHFPVPRFPGMHFLRPSYSQSIIRSSKKVWPAGKLLNHRWTH